MQGVDGETAEAEAWRDVLCGFRLERLFSDGGEGRRFIEDVDELVVVVVSVSSSLFAGSIVVVVVFVIDFILELLSTVNLFARSQPNSDSRRCCADCSFDDDCTSFRLFPDSKYIYNIKLSLTPNNSNSNRLRMESNYWN